MQKFIDNVGTFEVDDFNNLKTTIAKCLATKGFGGKCDVCSVLPEPIIWPHGEGSNKTQIMHICFKFVHVSVPSMATEPFWLITLRVN